MGIAAFDLLFRIYLTNLLKTSFNHIKMYEQKRLIIMFQPVQAYHTIGSEKYAEG